MMPRANSLISVPQAVIHQIMHPHHDHRAEKLSTSPCHLLWYGLNGLKYPWLCFSYVQPQHRHHEQHSSVQQILTLPMETLEQGRCIDRCGWPITPRWIYVLTILLWCSDAIATGTLFDVYINDLARRQGYPHPNEFIGIMESSRGITCLVVAVPLGFLFDRFDRLCVLRCAMICFGLTGALVLSIRSLH